MWPLFNRMSNECSNYLIAPLSKQVIGELIHKCEQNEQVYLHCEKMPVSDKNVTTVTVPCLGMIPREAWVTVLNKCQNLSIYHADAWLYWL